MTTAKLTMMMRYFPVNDDGKTDNMMTCYFPVNDDGEADNDFDECDSLFVFP